MTGIWDTRPRPQTPKLVDYDSLYSSRQRIKAEYISPEAVDNVKASRPT